MIPTRHYVTIDSTNLEAHRLFANGERGPLFLVADEQTAGKGRLARNWVSARGNCYSTLVLPLAPRDLISRPILNPGTASPEEKRQLQADETCPFPSGEGGPTGRMRSLRAASISAVPQIGFVVALAVAEVVRDFTNTTPQLKWPNDVLVRGAKIAGILTEVLSPSPLTIAIGCGINIAHAPMGLPYPATCLNAEAAVTDRDEVFQAYQTSLAHWLNIWNFGENFAAIRAAWTKLAFGIGETVTMTIGTQHLTGTFEGLTEQGAVILKPVDGPPHILHAGDLHIPSLARLRNGNT